MALSACGLALLAGSLLKGQCLAPWEEWHQYSSLCYNDIQPLYLARGVAEHRFPYIEAGIEYPVLTGLFMWVAGLFASDTNSYLIVSVLLLVPFALLVAHVLAGLCGRRALLWSAAPALALYAFHNWDLLVVAAATGGVWLWARDRPFQAAALFGIGGALKLYPLFFLLPLGLDLWARRRPREAVRAAAVGAGVFALVNLPFAVGNFNGWWAVFEFHQERGPNFDSIWAVRDFGLATIPQLEPARLNLVTGALTAVFFAIAVAAGALRARRERRFPFLPVCAALLAAFLLWNKVHSPQYTLWLLPFFALLNVPVGWWAAYSLVDLAVYVGVFRFFYEELCTGGECSLAGTPGLAESLMDAGVFVRAALLLVLFVVFLRAAAATEGNAVRPVASHPPATVGPTEIESPTR